MNPLSDSSSINRESHNIAFRFRDASHTQSASDLPPEFIPAEDKGFLQVDNGTIRVVNRDKKSQFSDVVDFVQQAFEEKKVVGEDKSTVISSLQVLTLRYKKDAKESTICKLINKIFGSDFILHRLLNTKTAVLNRAEDFIKKNERNTPSIELCTIKRQAEEDSVEEESSGHWPLKQAQLDKDPSIPRPAPEDDL